MFPHIKTLFFLMIASFAIGQTALPKISVKGNEFVDESGKVFVFRGLNISDPDNLERSGHWTKAHFEEVKAWGANIVRFPVHPTAWRKQGQEAYLKLMDQGIEWATQLGMYVIIDWHTIGNLRTEMYQDAMYETTRKETYEFWRLMAKKYRGNNTVAFFELFNEPTVYNGQLGSCSWAEWKAMNEEMILIIRANGGTAIPLVAGFNWAYDLTEIKNNPINAEGIGYVSHPYPQKREKPWEEKWTADWGYVKEKYPVILTEIGFCYPDDRGAHIPVISDESYGEAITQYCKERNISYVVWVFDPRWSPMMFSDWNYTPTRFGAYFKKAMSEK